MKLALTTPLDANRPRVAKPLTATGIPLRSGPTIQRGSLREVIARMRLVKPA